MGISSSASGRCPRGCTPSQWNRTPLLAQKRPIAATSWMIPVSLFPCKVLHNSVSGVSASANCARLIRPSEPTGRMSVRSGYRSLANQAEAWTSAAINGRPCGPPSRTPRITKLLASVPPEVRITRPAVKPQSAAKSRLVPSSTSRAARPASCREEGLAWNSPETRTSSSTASGNGGHEAASSK